MSYQYPYNYGRSFQQGYSQPIDGRVNTFGSNRNMTQPVVSAPYTQQPPSYQNYDPISLQMRLIHARQVNLMCKQSIVRNIILNNQGIHQQTSYPTSYSLQNNSVGSDQRRSNMHENASSSDSAQVPIDLQREKQADSERQQSLTTATFEAKKHESRTPTAVSSAEKLSSDSPVSEVESNGRSNNFAGNKVSGYQSVENSEVAASPREAVKNLSGLANAMTSTVKDNEDALNKLNVAKKKNAAASAAKTSASDLKKNIEKLLKHTEARPAIMPLWRHKLNGRVNPAPQSILKGARLFRAIVKSLLNMFIKPMLTNVKRRLQVREAERKALQKTLKLLSGSFIDWIGRAVQLPVSSVATDYSLNFEPTDAYSVVALNAQPLRVRMLQLKVLFRFSVLITCVRTYVSNS
jgi:hypothetical protein